MSFEEDVRNCRNDKLITDAIYKHDETDIGALESAIERLERALNCMARNEYWLARVAIKTALVELKSL